MLTKPLLVVSGLLTLIAAVPAPAPVPAPYAPLVAEPPAHNETHHHASFGNKHGNFHPTVTVKEGATGTLQKRNPGASVTISVVANWNSANSDDGIGGGTDSYKMYSGAGGTNEGWPARSQWVSFRNMFDNNKAAMSNSCSRFGVPNNSPDEIGMIWNAIQDVSQSSGVDHRFILAVILQESGGCVRAPTTNYGVRNPGLMQDHNGGYTCNDNGVVQTPCPWDSIHGMISEGARGTDNGDGLADCINQSGKWTDADFYRAARIYNSGSIAADARLEHGIATHCYASDIANRLTGWVYAQHGCTCDDNPASCGL